MGWCLLLSKVVAGLLSEVAKLKLKPETHVWITSMNNTKHYALELLRKFIATFVQWESSAGCNRPPKIISVLLLPMGQCVELLLDWLRQWDASNFCYCSYNVTPVLEAINSVSELLQSSTTDILTAQQQIRALGGELRRLRSDDIWIEAVSTATTMAKHLNVCSELPEERQRKLA